MGERQEGRGREGEVNCHAQLKQCRRLAMAGLTNHFRVIHRYGGQTDRYTGDSIGL